MIAICSSLSLREVLDHVARDAYPADRGCNRRSHSLSTKWVCKAKRALALFLLAFYHCSSRKVGGSATRRRGSLFAGDFCLQKSRRAYGPGLKNRFGRAEYVFDRPPRVDYEISDLEGGGRFRCLKDFR